MRKDFLVAPVITVHLALSGCASLLTTFNTDEPATTFSGTRWDSAVLNCAFGSTGSDCMDLNRTAGLLMTPIALVGLPFDLVSDTVLLPYTCAKRDRTDRE
jgi:uncharacterized protein YceK